MKDLDKVTLTYGQLRKLVSESKGFVSEARIDRKRSCIKREYKTTIKDVIEWYFLGAKFPQQVTEDDIGDDFSDHIVTGGEYFDKKWKPGKYMSDSGSLYSYLVEHKDDLIYGFQKFDNGNFDLVFRIVTENNTIITLKFSSPDGWYDNN